MDTASTISTGSSSIVKDFNVTIIYCDNAFPSDDLQSLFNLLQRHGRDSQFPFLSIFLSECTEMMRREVALLPYDIKKDLPPFQNISSLATHFVHNRLGPLSGALDGALLCIAQIGMFIGLVTTQPS